MRSWAGTSCQEPFFRQRSRPARGQPETKFAFPNNLRWNTIFRLLPGERIMLQRVYSALHPVISIGLAAFLMIAIPARAQRQTTEKSGERPAEKQATTAPQTEEAKQEQKEEEKYGMRYRLVGPFRGGRSLTASGIPGNPDVY